MNAEVFIVLHNLQLKNSDDKNKYERVFGNINSELDCFITDCFRNPS